MSKDGANSGSVCVAGKDIWESDFYIPVHPNIFFVLFWIQLKMLVRNVFKADELRM